MKESPGLLSWQKRENSMSGKKRIFLLALILAVACLAITAITIFMLYRASFAKQSEILVSTAQSQARLMESMAKFDETLSNYFPEGAKHATLDQIIDAHKRYRGIGRTGEFTLAKREGENIVFLLSHRYYDFDTPKPVSTNSKLAEPMRLALSARKRWIALARSSPTMS